MRAEAERVVRSRADAPDLLDADLLAELKLHDIELETPFSDPRYGPSLPAIPA